MSRTIRKSAWSLVLTIGLLSLAAASTAASPVIEPQSAGQVVETSQLTGHLGAVYSIAWSPDGSRIATGSSDGTAHIWDAQTGTSLLILEEGTASRWGVAWSPDGTRVVTVRCGSMVRIWNAKTGEMLAELGRLVQCTLCVAWSPNGARLALGEGDGTIVLLDSSDLRIVAEWPGHVEGGLSTEVIAIAWSPDGTRLASGGLDFALRIWDAATGAPLAVLRATTYARNDINGVAWSPDGRQIATAGHDGYVRLWDPAERVEVRSFREISGDGDIVALSAGQHRALARSLGSPD